MEWQHKQKENKKRLHFGACILVLANHFQAHFWNRTSGRGATICCILTSANRDDQPRNLATDHNFLGKFGADLYGPEHLAKKPFPQSTVLSQLL